MFSIVPTDGDTEWFLGLGLEARQSVILLIALFSLRHSVSCRNCSSFLSMYEGLKYKLICSPTTLIIALVIDYK